MIDFSPVLMKLSYTDPRLRTCGAYYSASWYVKPSSFDEACADGWMLVTAALRRYCSAVTIYGQEPVNIYVGNLSFSATEETVKNAFSAYGAVTSVRVVKDKYSGQSRGFAFVEMPDAEATAAINGLNGKSLDGRAISVNEARPREDAPRREATSARPFQQRRPR